MRYITRKEILLKGIKYNKATGLELGPLAWPVLTKDEADIYYLDHLPTLELKQKYKDDKKFPISMIVDVDYSLKKSDTLKKATLNKKFNYVIASHIIEHVPDIISWLDEISNVLDKDGILSLAIPDKRYTFDINRPVSTAGQIIGSYLEKRKIPSAEQVIDYGLSTVEVDARKIWDGQLFLNAPKKFTQEEVIKMSKKSIDQNIYQDCHCFVFTPHSFLEIFKQLVIFDLMPFKIINYVPTRYAEYEFFVQLQKIDPNKEKILDSIPKLPRELSKRELEKQIEQLKNNNNSLENKIHGYEQSRSWKVTKPIRKISKTYTKLKPGSKH